MQHWVCVGPLNRLSQPGSFESGVYLDMPWVVTRAEDGQLRAFHNVSTGIVRHVPAGELSCNSAPSHVLKPAV